MKIGYACINLTLPSKFKTCRLKTVENEGLNKVKELTIHNFNEVLKNISWNIEQGIYFYRISSDLVPFATHEIMTWVWEQDPDVLNITKQIKTLTSKYSLRLTMHPGQYSILNSPNPEIVRKAILDLEYHSKVLNLVKGTDMIIHVGGAYGNKEEAKERFIETYQTLSKDIKSKLRLENDDKTFHIKDVIDIYQKTGIPILFDYHHNRCNPSSELELTEALTTVFKSWESVGRPKMHISSGRNAETDTAHHDFILEQDFIDFLRLIGSREVDIMFESKRKDESVLRIYQHLKKGTIVPEEHGITVELAPNLYES
ncbi:UV DNA damage repair endonuclease UvsE [Halalkalibacter krulwichiae]|uniref:UV DNA damage endonuclease n=1 Tax=Halalkalibacter krulwichiae TaxID=199441 RepID=A0A1X9MCQ4_9BACI|nr:UV DNA damage repair endonuclease UvsE [Halalkalibacter krulwichiae]ARK30424.1 UV DNA damage endonuclease [Halalkalibacter krulwichiae]